MPYPQSKRTADYGGKLWYPQGEDKPPSKFMPVFGYGGAPGEHGCINRIAVIGEGPGYDEDQQGVPFVGRTGYEVDRFLTSNEIVPDNCFFTNVTRIFKGENANPGLEEVEEWGWLLKEELSDAKPWWIFALGRFAARYFLGDVDMDTVHGIPYLVRYPWLDNGRDGRVIVISIVHPAAGLRNPDSQPAISYGFEQAANTVKGKITPRTLEDDQYPNPNYRDITNSGLDLAAIISRLSGGSKAEPLIVAIDTEGLPGNPWGLSFSTEPGTAFVIRKVHELALKVLYAELVKGIRAGRLHIILHNSLHDLRVLRELGIPIPDGSFTDTMVLAYHLVVEPQGLKALAYRHCGMVMDAYEEIVQPAQDRIALDYYHRMAGLVEPGTSYRSIPTGVVEVRCGYHPDGGFEEAHWFAHCDEVPERVGPFAYVPPYEVRERDKKTGELRVRMKKVQQIDTRVSKALKELEAGKIDAAGLRKRWDGTDELIRRSVEDEIGEMREAGLDDVPLERAVKYSARDADATIRIYPILLERHRAMGLERVSAIDHAIIPMVDRMQAEGIELDIPHFERLIIDLQRRKLEVQRRIKQNYGVWINPNSGDQVADLLFRPEEHGGLGLSPTGRMTKGRKVKDERGDEHTIGIRNSTVDKVLEGLRAVHPAVGDVLEYRGLDKAETSFARVAVRRAVQHRNGRWYLHCLFRITRVSSGRLSATKPNLMAVMGGDLGKEIRDGYIAGEGYRFSEWDLNQVEMRVMASDANCKFLIEMFMADEDVHTATADKMFNLNLQRPYSKAQVKGIKLPSGVSPRDPAKRVGFGVITGIQGKGLVDQMRLQGVIVTENEASEWIEKWFKPNPEVRQYMLACHSEARSKGYVRDWAGRIRYLPGINSPWRNIRQEAARQSHSHKIQGGAQEIMKIAMAKIWKEVLPDWWEKGRDVAPILQIHDALMLRHNLNDEELSELDMQVRAAMFSSAPPNFRIPLDAGSGTAASWGALEH